jgi:hypothetical protein
MKSRVSGVSTKFEVVRNGTEGRETKREKIVVRLPER